MNDLDKLYREIIMDHYKNPHHKGLRNGEEYKNTRLKNSSCGDEVTIQLKIKDHKIEEVNFDGSGCSISMSSASILTDVLTGKTVAEAKILIEDFFNLVKGETVKHANELEDAIVYKGVSNYPARVKCACLAWHAALDGMSGDENE